MTFFSVEFQRVGSVDIFSGKTWLHQTVPSQECVPLIQLWENAGKYVLVFLF